MTVNFDFSLLSPTAHTIAIFAYIDFLPSLQYSKPLGTSRFLKTIQCLSPNGYVVTKLLIKPLDVAIDMRPYLNKLDEVKLKLQDIPNTLPYESLIDSERATYLIRPYIRYNLYDRLSIRPFFESIEKKWIVYQLLVALSKMHEVGICHGDLKTENVLLTSWNWILLSDIALFKPVYLPDHNQSQFSFYFDSIQRHSCYIAPERFKTQAEIDELMQQPQSVQVVPPEDIFSLGCVIAELYTDGLPLFTLPQMFQYRKGQYIPNLDAIEDINIRRLIYSMISLDPNERLSAKEYLLNFRKIIFPDFFYTFLYPYMRSLSTNNVSGSLKFQTCDQVIERLHKDFDKISLYLGFKKNIIETDERNEKESSNQSLIPVALNLPGMKNHIPQSTSHIFTPEANNDCSSLILLSVLCNNVRNTTHSSFRIKACDLILAFAEQLHDEAKLDRCLPYLINMLDDPSENVQTTALTCMTQLLMMIDTITPINVHVFIEYIIPKLQVFLKRSYLAILSDSSANIGASNNIAKTERAGGSYVRMVFACCLPHLAMTSKKFFDLSILLKSKAGIYRDPNYDESVDGNKDRTKFEFDEIIESFENLTIQILTDNDIYVRIALIRNLKPLCSFFGKDKTNDVILSHLITYLNDKNPQLKLAFVSAIIPLSIFVGVTSLEQYILPLLIQTLYEPEEIIVVTLLKVLSQLVSLGLIRRDCFWDLMNLTTVLILHPNGLIRQSVINLIIIIGNQLSAADFYCMLYPLIRPFFQHEVTSFTWENLYIAAHTPLSRSIYNSLKNWSVSNDDTLFWQRVSSGNGLKNIDYFGNAKISFLRKKASNGLNSTLQSISNTANAGNLDNFVPNFEVPLSNSDLKQINRLKSLGFLNTELWKIATLRSYMFRVSRLETRSFKKVSAGFEKMNLLPRSVFYEVNHSYEPVTNGTPHPSQGLRGGVKTAHTEDGYAAAGRETKESGRLLLKNLQMSKPIVTTTDEMVFAETASSAILTKSRGIFEDFGDSNVYDETMQLKKILTKASFSYSGRNKFILKFLNSLQFEPDLEDYFEFGNLVDTSIVEETDAKDIRSSSTILVSRISQHQAAIVDIILSPDSEYFISADSQGVLKVWESRRLELDVTGEPCLSFNSGSPIKSMCMMEKRHCFAVSKMDGSVSIFRVDFISSLEKRNNLKYKNTSISLLRRWKVDPIDRYALKLQFSIIERRPYLFMLTPTSKLIALDVRTMKQVYCYQNDVLHGATTAFTVNNRQSWAVLGTRKGVLDLWDLDAGVCVKSTKLKHGSFPIKSMTGIENLFQNAQVKTESKYISFVGATGDSDTIIWDVERALPRYVLCSSNKQHFSTVDMYSVQDVKTDLHDQLLDMKFSARNAGHDGSCTAVAFGWSKVGKAGKILSALHKKKIIEWDLDGFENSRVVVDTDANMYNSENAPVFSETQVNSMLSFVHERYVSKGDNNPLNKSSKPQTLSSANVPKLSNDKITAILFLNRPYKMVVCGDRSGCINVYK